MDFSRLRLGVATFAALAGLGLLTAGSAGAVWSGVDGKLVFSKFDTTSQNPVAQIFSMNVNGKGQKNLSAAGGAAGQLDIQPAVSPDGKRIAFTHFDPVTGSAQIWVMSFQGHFRTDISNDGTTASESGPAWSADGSKILFVRQPAGSFPGDQGPGPASAGGQIWIRNADGTGTPQQLTTGPHDANPVMSNDGSMIAFSRPVGGVRHLFVMNANGTGAARDLGPGAKPDWSPDDTHLVYGQGGTGPIMVVSVSNPADKQTLTGFGDEAPVWSPDGRQIAFLDCAGPNQVCEIAVMNANGQNQRDLTHDQTLSNQKVDWQAHAHKRHHR
jgi:Tol biopolymer transport system component